MPEGHRIELWIGINLGDIIVDGEDINGDGVNLAGRLEGEITTCNAGFVRPVAGQMSEYLTRHTPDEG